MGCTKATQATRSRTCRSAHTVHCITYCTNGRSIMTTKIFFFRGALLHRGEKSKECSAICKIKEQRIESAGMLSSYDMMLQMQSYVDPQFALKVVFERNTEARHKEKTDTEEYSRSNIARTNLFFDILNQQHPEDTINRDKHEA